MAHVPLSPAAREKMLNLPASPPPPGVQPNFVNPDSVAFSAQCALHGLHALSTIVFFIKMYAQIWIDRQMGLENYVLALAWVLYTGAFEPVGVLLARAPMGVHQWDITFRQFGRYLFLQYTLLVIWGILILLLKITILAQYLRVFVPHGTRNFTFWAAQVLLYTNGVYYVAFTFIQIFSCSPRETWWDKTIVEGHCIDIFAINQRISACIASVVRLYYNIKLFQDQTDVTHQLSFMSFWGTAQIPAAFLVVCLPSVPKVIKYARSKPCVDGKGAYY
ncbi:uncharacterized protein PG986_014053 [Apiospora aurea]|uniref:Rhodopsin domain-containing protein n=1 Tax=Apiospora aurea TaxID=335848 RepID=A0ABR1PRX0_9PEZI